MKLCNYYSESVCEKNLYQYNLIEKNYAQCYCPVHINDNKQFLVNN